MLNCYDCNEPYEPPQKACARCGATLDNPELIASRSAQILAKAASASAPAPAPVAAPTYPLYNDQAVGLATLLGSPLAGSILMAMNYARLSQVGAAAAIVLGGLIVTGLLMVVAYNIPGGRLTYLIPLLLMFGAKRLAEALQGRQVQQHLGRGGKLGSRWAAAGLGLVVFAVLFGIAYSYLSSQESN